MRTKYTGAKSVALEERYSGSLPDLMNNPKVYKILKNDSYIMFRGNEGIWKPSFSKRYKPTRYEQRCIEMHTILNTEKDGYYRYHASNYTMQEKIYGRLPELLLKKEAAYIYKDDEYIIFRDADEKWSESKIKEYNLTNYEKLCIKNFK